MKFAKISLCVIKQLCETITTLCWVVYSYQSWPNKQAASQFTSAGDLCKEALLCGGLFGLQGNRDVRRCWDVSLNGSHYVI